MEYTISQSEIFRRKKAFLSLIICILVGIVLASYIFNIQVSGLEVFLVIMVGLLVIWLTWWFLASLSKTKLCLGDEYIERIDENDSQRVYLSDIEVIKIRRRTSGIIREIYLWSRNNKKLFFSGFEDNFKDIELYIRKKILVEKIKEERELFDFDHWLFYPFLGILLGILGIGLMVLLQNLSDNILFIFLFIFSIFMFLLSMYFIFSQPISARRGKKSVIVDYLIGVIMFLGCVFVWWVYEYYR